MNGTKHVALCKADAIPEVELAATLGASETEDVKREFEDAVHPGVEGNVTLASKAIGQSVG